MTFNFLVRFSVYLRPPKKVEQYVKIWLATLSDFNIIDEIVARLQSFDESGMIL
jgi:hypothetical protein